MIHFTRTIARKWLDGLLHIHDSPQRTAAAFALGVLWGFSPFLGLHTALALACAFLFNLNRVAVLLGAYANLPWILGPYYTVVTVVTARVMGFALPPDFHQRARELFALSLYHADFWNHLATLMRPLVLPYLIGSTVASIVLAGIAYRASLAFVLARRRPGPRTSVARQGARGPRRRRRRRQRRWPPTVGARRRPGHR